MKTSEAAHRITPSTQIVADDPRSVAEANKLIDMLAPAMGFRLCVVENVSSQANVIVLSLYSSLNERLGTEGYRLNVTPQRIDIRAAEPAGLCT